MLPKIDLLGAKPLAGEAAASARRAFDFLWATGSGVDALDDALRPTSPASGDVTTFEPGVFAGDLFVTELSRRCMPVVVEGRTRVIDFARLEAILARPPRDPRTVAHRRAVLREIARADEVRRGLEAFYVRSRELRDTLESRGGSRDRSAEHVRRIEALSALRRAIDALADVDARAPLDALVGWARDVRASTPFARLCDLLTWEAGAATVELSMTIGADGAVRGVTMLARREVPHPRGDGPLARFLLRLWRVLRGERWDERELVMRLVDEIMDGLADVAIGVLRVGLDLEPHLASMGLRDRARRAGLDACFASLSFGSPSSPPDEGGGGGGGGGGASLRFADLYNPFLLADAAAKDAPPPVACDLTLDGAPAIAVVTGPNSGGKTRLLQSVGVAVLLARGGFFVPARSASIPWTPAIFASLAQTATHDAPEGRLGTELLRVRDVFERARPGCLVLLDELCSGTNPSEAEELVRFVLAELAEAKASTIVTTHLLDVARRLESDPPAAGLVFRRVELDDDERPTYRFAHGVASSSLARRTAERLGVTREALARLVREGREHDGVETSNIDESLSHDLARVD